MRELRVDDSRLVSQTTKQHCLKKSIAISQDELVPLVPDQVPDLHRDRSASDGPQFGVDVRDVPPQGLRAGRHHEAKLPTLSRAHQRLRMRIQCKLRMQRTFKIGIEK